MFVQKIRAFNVDEIDGWLSERRGKLLKKVFKLSLFKKGSLHSD